MKKNSLSLRDYMNPKTIQNFIEKINANEETGCWNWIASKYYDGYGQFNIKPRSLKAHRVSYTIFYCKIPQDREIHHTCENKLCVNPSHLVEVTRQEHIELTLKHNKHKTHCPKGHEYTEDNTYTELNNRRHCKRCMSSRDYAKSYRNKYTRKAY